MASLRMCDDAAAYMTCKLATSSLVTGRLQPAVHRIRARYDWEKVADAHDSFFRAVAARHGIPVSHRPFPTDLGAEPSP